MGGPGEMGEKKIKPAADVAASDGAPKAGMLDAELLADFGHQVRNQLNAVVGAAGLLSTSATSSEERELASIVEIGAEQIARLVDDVLDAATIRSGEFELALHPFDGRASVESCIGIIADAAGAKGPDLSFQAAPDVPGVIIGDSRRLEQIVLSLLHGGVERTYRGGVGVELGFEDKGGLVALRFTIRDTGRGIPARILRGGLDGATNPGDRLEPGDRLAVLSLATTRRLVEMMDGELRVEQGGVEAGPDAGTSFAFTILAEVLPASVTTSQLTLQSEQWGATATSATPEEALAVVTAGHPFDIVVVEHRPPVIEGLELSS